MGTLIFQGITPLPPSVNQGYKVICMSIRRRKVYRIGPTPELEQYKRDADLSLKSDGTYCNWNEVNLIKLPSRKAKIPLAVSIAVYFKTPWKRDVDGVIKYVIDATFKRLGLNDNLVVDVHTRRFVDADNPRCEITIATIESQAA